MFHVKHSFFYPEDYYLLQGPLGGYIKRLDLPQLMNQMAYGTHKDLICMEGGDEKWDKHCKYILNSVHFTK